MNYLELYAQSIFWNFNVCVLPFCFNMPVKS